MNILKGSANLLGKVTKFVVSATASSTSSIVTGFKEGYNGVEAIPTGPKGNVEDTINAKIDEVTEEMHQYQSGHTKTP
tara:strand:- start:46 stop:279 length:234 start_codon:yes stop_codon:yes gene_type:complete